MDVPAAAAGTDRRGAAEARRQSIKGTLIARIESDSRMPAQPPRAGRGGTRRGTRAAASPRREAGAGGRHGADAACRGRAAAAEAQQPQLDAAPGAGSGPGGYTAAFRAADLGMKVIWWSVGRRWAACV